MFTHLELLSARHPNDPSARFTALTNHEVVPSMDATLHNGDSGEKATVALCPTSREPLQECGPPLTRTACSDALALLTYARANEDP